MAHAVQMKRDELTHALAFGQAREYLLQREQQMLYLISLEGSENLPSFHEELHRIQQALANHDEPAFLNEELATLNRLMPGTYISKTDG